MRAVELEIDKLVGYAIGGAEEKRIRKLGSAKLGEKKLASVVPGELSASADRAAAAAE